MDDGTSTSGGVGKLTSMLRRDYKECLRLIETQLKSCDGMCEYPLYVKGLILRGQGKVQEALELFQAATLLNPSNHANLKQVGKCLFLLGKHSASIDVLDEAMLCARREDWEIQHNKGLCFMFLKEYEKALEAFQTANSIQRHDSTFVEMGKIYTATGDLKRAIEVYLEALEFSPDNPELLTTVGLLYLRDGENFKAFEYLGNSLTRDPRNPKTILAAGSVIQDHSDMDVALVKYRVAAVKTPNSAQLWNNIGMCFFGKARHVAAIACLKRSLYLDPFQWITAHNLGLVFMHTTQYASAFHYLSTSINLKPSFAASYMYLAIVLSRLEDAESAVAAYEKALQLDPDDPVCHLNFASTLHNIGERERARAQFQSYTILCSRMTSDERRALMETCAELHTQVSKMLQVN
ncbi:Photosystem I assembly protein Ycf3 [Hondaea fermentalgiana]|uniref:Photosystem I assembly protein Ycf3 n=1 Tax=Hondaea fermentalgiana TaxID=2315210 RepID=A0A2R5G2K9_9STRA|nr:Photosystem I assembly protein Ycf3 [Hondaea fermentalgiana]|eukprot:GBG24775.1 Photosystem I assembly protein Ycf3 [Hondaea fermentalgiana]